MEASRYKKRVLKGWPKSPVLNTLENEMFRKITR